MSDLEAKIREAFAAAQAELGRSAKSIRKCLARRSIKGRRCQCDRCPLANYYRYSITVAVGIDVEVSTDGTTLQVFYRDANCKLQLVKFDMANHESTFVDRFDHKKYPELIA